MQIINSDLIKGKKVLLRLDIDVPLEKVEIRNSKFEIRILDDFRLKTGLPTLKLCLENAQEVIIMGHLGRPHKVEPELSVKPIYDWLEKELEKLGIEGVLGGKLKLLENLRFESGEEECNLDYAKELAALGDVFVNEAFAAYHESASTTVLPTLLPHFAGLRFAQEVEKLTCVREAPRRPLVAIIGGAKVEDKLPVVEAMSKIADYVLVGGKIAQGEALRGKASPYENVLLADLNEEGTDVTPQTLEKWKPIIREAKMIVWNGPLGKVEDPKNFQTHTLANLIVQAEALSKGQSSSGRESILGGGDTIGYLGKLGLLEKFSFVSTGGGAMLKFLETGTLSTIQALK